MPMLRSARSGGFRAWGNETAWYVQMLGNHITEGYGTEGYSNGLSLGPLTIVGIREGAIARLTHLLLRSREAAITPLQEEIEAPLITRAPGEPGPETGTP